MTFELQINKKKQEKLVELLNKKNVVYSYYTNFLRYEYKKYQVRNSDMLIAHLKEYGNYKYVTSRYDSIRNIMYQAQENLERFLKEKNINMDSVSIEKFANTISIDDKIAFCKEITQAKEETEEKLKVIDEKHEEIWNQIVDISNRDWSGKEIIESLMLAYSREVEKINFEYGDEETEEDYDMEVEEV